MKAQAAAWLLLLAPRAACLENGVGRTPLMGWMAWMRFRCNINCDLDPENCISERLIKEMADTMVTDGWRDLGYEYVSLDDCWQSSVRAADGAIQPNASRFPSGMKALGDYLHSRGLKFGLYTAMGAESCMGYPALGCNSVEDCAQARRDVATYVSWGVDYMKVDTCRNAEGKVFRGAKNFNTTHPLVSSWFLEMGKAANRRPVLYHPSGISLRDGSMPIDGGVARPHQFKLFGKIANMWRAFKDMQPVWSEVDAIIEYWAADNETAHPRHYPTEWEDFLSISRPGVFQDPDALLVGNVNSSASCRPCLATLPHDQYCVDRQHPDAPCICCGGLTPVEEQTNMVMWAMFAAPLEIAADLRHIPAPSADILRNAEVIAIDQDALVSQGRRVSKSADGRQVWQKRLVGGYVAVALFNANDVAVPIPLLFEEVGFASCDRVAVRDVLGRRDLGVHVGALSGEGAAMVPGHGVALFRLSIAW